MLLDALKGFLASFPILCITLLIPSMSNNTIIYDFFFNGKPHLNIYPLIGGFMASIGHSFPLYYKFKGGKNVMVVAGMIIGTSPQLFLLALLIFLIVLFVTRRVAPASISAAGTVIIGGLIPVFLAGFNVDPAYKYMGIYFNENSYFLFDWIAYIFYMFSAGLVIFRHKKNIEKIINHEDKPDF